MADQPRRSRRQRPEASVHSANGAQELPRRRQTPGIAASALDPARSTDETISEDDLCPICQLLLYRPVTTRCNHTLCESCMAHWADVSISQQRTVVDVDEELVAFDPVSELEAKCPMCRTQTVAVLDPARATELVSKYPRTWAERKAEEEEGNEGRGGEGSVQSVTLYIGNRHQLIPTEDELEDGRSNRHQWTFFVKPSRNDIIEEVQILLHPTFRPPRVIRQRPPYEVSRIGWGFFTITAYVILKAGYSWVSSDAEDSPDGAAKGMLPLEWTLDFDGFGGKGSMGRFRLKVKNDREWQGVSDEEQRDDREWQRMVRQYQRDGRYEPIADDA